MKEKKLNLGCGKDIKDGYINVDSVKLPGVDIVHDLNKFPWPFKDDEFDEVYASHILEHLKDTLKVMEELHRITKKTGVIKIKVPLVPGPAAFSDPTHRSFFTYFTFDYFTGKRGDWYSRARFKIIKRKFVFSWNKWLNWISFFINLFPVVYQRFFAALLPSNELYIELQPIK